MRFLGLISLLCFSLLYGRVEFIRFTTPLEIKSYLLIERFARIEDKKVIATRLIVLSNNRRLCLCIDVENLTTSLYPEKNLYFIDFSNFTNTLYIKALNFFSSNKVTFGETNKSFISNSERKKILLTTDLCPSTNRLDYEFYNLLDNKLPFIIFFSGEWITNHRMELSWIMRKNLNFLAGNHTYHHHIIKDNFSEEKLTTEITNTEVEMLKSGLIPSCFFRFPGLKYKTEHIKTLTKLNLIPLSVNFWAGQKYIPENSILLTHSNGNLKVEVKLFKKFLISSNQKIKNGEIEFITPAEWLKLKNPR
ncbi:MAG: polysaccharide deacetylase family protein [Brevinematia bacterium]